MNLPWVLTGSLRKSGGSVHYGWFKVAEYRKPEYEVTVSADKEVYIAGGDDISAQIAANYYFGKPVADAKVKYAVYCPTVITALIIPRKIWAILCHG